MKTRLPRKSSSARKPVLQPLPDKVSGSHRQAKPLGWEFQLSGFIPHPCPSSLLSALCIRSRLALRGFLLSAFYFLLSLGGGFKVA
jgi:hypothetical protein